MSNAAATVPAKRSVYRAKTSRIPSLDDHKQQKRTKNTNKQNTQRKHSNADVLKIKHKASDKDKDDDDDQNSKHFDQFQETWMTQTEDVSNARCNTIDQSCLLKDKRRLGKTTDDDANERQNNVNKSTIKILHVQQYDNLIEERSELLTLNEKYSKRISELEQETTKVLAEFSKLYEDHERLSRKMDTGKDPLIEPYSRVFEDRRILRDAEDGYKKRILRLEIEVNEKQSDYNKLQDEIKRLKAKFKPNTENMLVAMKQKEAKMQKEITKLQNENDTLRSKLEELETLPKQDVKDTYTYKKPKPKLTLIKDSQPLAVKFAVEKKRDKFDYEYNLPDSLVSD